MQSLVKILSGSNQHPVVGSRLGSAAVSAPAPPCPWPAEGVRRCRCPLRRALPASTSAQTGVSFRSTMRRLAAAAGSGIRSHAAPWLAWAPAGATLLLAVKGCWPALPGFPCPLRTLTGIPCPTCFLTRATAAALSGQLELSLRLHAFGPLVAATLLVWSVAAIRRRRLLPWSLRLSTVVPLCAGLVGYWLARLILQFRFGVQAFVGLP